ncbi:hypothetical protein ACQPZZ_33415 [Microbispora sp. CA-135349]|uniref:hypothetical protein n=1 Tax=Microbispora sp. CA-135349 TaxID=3239953 RepID=UPI003D8D927D
MTNVTRREAGLIVAALGIAAVCIPAPAYAASGGLAGPTCRHTSSSLSGASARGTLCWQKLSGEIRFTVDGSLKDSAGDGRYAVFRVHYRSRTAVGWSTHTKDIRTTKGHNAPVSLYVDWRGSASRGLKDFWMQVCKQGGGKRTCDSHWH